MISKEQLRYYRSYNLEIKALTDEINSLYTPIKSPNNNGGGHSNTPSDPTALAVARIDRLSKKREDLIKLVADIEEYVDSIDNSEISAIIRYHYFLGLTWQQTSFKLLGYYAPDMLKKSVYRYLKCEIEA